jgi:hypothetical protein
MLYKHTKISLFTKKFYHIVDSSDRISGSSNNFTIKIPMPNENNYNRIILNSAVIPKSFYLIRETYNTFTIKEGGSTYTISIPIGNYTLNEFLAQIRLLLVAPLNFTYTMIFTKRTGKFTFSVTGNAGVQPQFIFTTNVFEPLGFDKNSTNVFVGDSLTSTNIINLNPNEMVYICTDLVNNAENQILEAIPMCNIPDYSYQYYQNTTTHTMKELTNGQNQTFIFQIKDSFHRLLDLNGKNIVFTICCHKDEMEMTNELVRESLIIHNADKLQSKKGSTSGLDTMVETVPNLDASIYTIGFTQ